MYSSGRDRWTLRNNIKGTVSRDWFGFWWHIWLVLDRNFLAAQLIFTTQKNYFSWLMRVYVGVYVVQVSLLLIFQQGSKISSIISSCFLLAGGLCKFFANAGGKQPMQRQLLLLLLLQYKQQANTLLSIHNYCTLHLWLGGMTKISC